MVHLCTIDPYITYAVTNGLPLLEILIVAEFTSSNITLDSRFCYSARVLLGVTAAPRAQRFASQM